MKKLLLLIILLVTFTKKEMHKLKNQLSFYNDRNIQQSVLFKYYLLQEEADNQLRLRKEMVL